MTNSLPRTKKILQRIAPGTTAELSAIRTTPQEISNLQRTTAEAEEQTRTLQEELQQNRNQLQDLTTQVTELQSEINRLDQDLDESRRLNLRAAELLDIVASHLFPAQSNDSELHHAGSSQHRSSQNN